MPAGVALRLRFGQKILTWPAETKPRRVRSDIVCQTLGVDTFCNKSCLDDPEKLRDTTLNEGLLLKSIQLITLCNGL